MASTRAGIGAWEQPKARTIGVVYLLYFLAAFSSLFLAKGLLVPGDAAATSNNIVAHEALFRSGIAMGLISNAIYVAVTALFYGLFEPVDRSVSLIAAFVSLVGCATQIFAGILELAPLAALADAQLASALKAEQLQAASLLSLKLYVQSFHISLVLFGFYDVLLGYLIFRSTFLPRILGVLLMLAGVGWLAFLWPPLANAVSSFVMPFGGLAEIALMLWLIIKGVSN